MVHSSQAEKATVDAREDWQQAQGQLYSALGQQLKTLWANGNGHKAQEGATEAVPMPSGPEPPPPPPHYCQAHQTAFKRFEKDGRVWYSHKGPDGRWCKEK